MKVLITGATGLVGGAIAKHLVQKKIFGSFHLKRMKLKNLKN
mgnify:CR=1 FL=1